MKHHTYALVAIAATLAVGCDKQKSEIDEAKDATIEAIDVQKEAVNADALDASQRSELNARLDRATIEADRISDNAQLDAEKKRAEAEADAAKARLDAENP